MANKSGPPFRFVGKTTDGRRVVCGRWVFHQIDSMGVPFQMLLDRLNQSAWVVGWMGFFVESQASARWARKTVLARCREAVCDVFGLDYFGGWVERFDLMWPDGGALIGE